MKPRLLFHALRTARPRQLRGRALRPLARRRFPSGAPPPFAPPSGPVELWRSPAFEPTHLAGTGAERLRAFHAQYGEEVLGLAREGDAEGARAAMLAWIESNPPRPGDAWHPYPLSTRVGNWLAALALEPEAATSAVVESLWRQLLHLDRNVEHDVLGNHVIRNTRALVLGGVAFASSRLIDHGLSLLARELPEQVLSDGGHYERSPVYHLIVLRDLLEVDAVLPGSVPGEVLARMRSFAAALARPDGAPALFNDGALDLVPALDLPPARDGLSLFPETGYAVLRRDGVWLAFDCGASAPSFLPAHAHADALSFQLWIDGRPVVIDPGMPTYEPGAERDWFRGTRAHSTVSVDGRDQFELWGAFRSGPLPRVELLEAGEGGFSAAVDWKGARHRRRIALDGRTVVVEDVVEGRAVETTISSLPLAPETQAGVTATAGTAERESRPLSERLYERRDGPALVVSLRGRLPLASGWRIEPAER